MSGPEAGYVSAPAQLLLRVIEELSLRPLEPSSAASIVENLGESSRDQVFRSLKNLEHAGWAEQTPAGLWRLTDRPTLMAERVRLALADFLRRHLGAA